MRSSDGNSSAGFIFKLSSKARQAYIDEGRLVGPEEYAARKDQMNWWDFKRAQSAIDTLRSGRPLHLTGVYNRADGGELTGEEHIIPFDEGMLVIFDGVAICHLSDLEELMYVYAPPEVRLERLRSRDIHRQGKEVLDRFAITQEFELRYFPSYWDRITMFVSNSVDSPKLLPAFTSTFALAPPSEEAILRVV